MTTGTECGAEKWHGGRRVTCRELRDHHGDHRGLFTYHNDLKWSALTGIDGAWEVPEVVPASLKFSSGRFADEGPDHWLVRQVKQAKERREELPPRSRPAVPKMESLSRGGYVKAKPDMFVVDGGFVELSEAGQESATRILREMKKEPPAPTHEKVMADAKHLLNEDRYEDYGDPHENFARIAGMWSAYLGSRITADQVAVMMTLMKCSRLAHSPDHRDSYVDGVAYLAIAAELQEDHHA